MIAGRRVISRAAVALLATSGIARPLCAQQRLTREQVLGALAGATAQTPADFTGQDLSGLDLTGVDFKRANLTRCRLVGTNFTKAQLFAATLTDAVATDADFTGATLDMVVMYRADLRRAVLRDASLFAVIMPDADLSDADLSRAKIVSPMAHAKLIRAKLVHASLGVDPGTQSMGVLRTDATSADAFAAALCVIAVDADALVAPVVITEPSLGYEKPEVSEGVATGGATTVAVPPPSAPGTTTRTAHA